MTDLGLFNFIKNGLERGETKEQITETLLKGNWNQAQIDEAFASVETNSPPISGFGSPAPVQSSVPASAEGWIGKGILMALWIIAVIVFGGVGYTAYAMYGENPTQAVASSLTDSLTTSRYHMNFNFESTSTQADARFSMTIPTDVDATDPSDIRVHSLPSISSSLFSGNGEITLLGNEWYGKIDSLSLLGVGANGTFTGTWFSFNKNDLQNQHLTGMLSVNPSAILAQASTSPSAQLQSLMEYGVLVTSGHPSLSFEAGAPVLNYTFTINTSALSSYLAEEYNLSASTDGLLANFPITYGPLSIKKNLLTNQLVSVDGSISYTMSPLFGGVAQTQDYIFHADYQPLTSVSIEAPATSTPISDFLQAMSPLETISS